jgi:hypothetical protein
MLSGVDGGLSATRVRLGAHAGFIEAGASDFFIPEVRTSLIKRELWPISSLKVEKRRRNGGVRNG